MNPYYSSATLRGCYCGCPKVVGVDITMIDVRVDAKTYRQDSKKIQKHKSKPKGHPRRAAREQRLQQEIIL